MFIFIETLFIALLAVILILLYRHEQTLLKKNVSKAMIEEYWNGAERRQYTRFKKTLEVTYFIEKKPHLKICKTVDISQGGAKLLLGEKLSVGTIMAMRIVIPDSRKMIELEGNVVWSTEEKAVSPSGKRLFYSGIRFLALKEPSDAHLIDYIKSISNG